MRITTMLITNLCKYIRQRAYKLYSSSVTRPRTQTQPPRALKHKDSTKYTQNTTWYLYFIWNNSISYFRMKRKTVAKLIDNVLVTKWYLSYLFFICEEKVKGKNGMLFSPLFLCNFCLDFEMLNFNVFCIKILIKWQTL